MLSALLVRRDVVVPAHHELWQLRWLERSGIPGKGEGTGVTDREVGG